MPRLNVRYDVRFNGTAYEVVRTRTFLLSTPAVETYSPFATREEADAEVKFREGMDTDKFRDRAGR